MKFALFGTGFIGKVHANNIAAISVLEGDEVTYPSLMDGLRAQTIAEAAVEVLHTHRPVKITYWQPK